MKITAMDYDIQIDLKMNKINVIVIESPILFRKFLLDLEELWEGKTCGIVVSEDDKIVKLKEYMDILNSPLYIDINVKKVIEDIS